MKLLQHPLIRQWILLNYLGWLLGVILGPVLYLLVIFPAVWLTDSLDKIFTPVFLSVPLGVSVGALQSLAIKWLKLPPCAWTLLSILASVTAAIISTWLFPTEKFSRDITVFFLIPMIAGLNIGVFQTIYLHKLISKPALWIVSYIGGVFVALIMVVMITITAFATSDFIIKALYALELWDVVWNRDLVLTIFNLLAMPIWLTFVIGLSTGNILQKNLGDRNTV